MQRMLLWCKRLKENEVGGNVDITRKRLVLELFQPCFGAPMFSCEIYFL
jgi:hypothetical protein